MQLNWLQKQPPCSIKKVFLKISQSSQEDTCARAWGMQLYLKRDSGTCLFLWILRTFLRTLILKNISERLLLWLVYLYDGNIYFKKSLAKVPIWYFLKKMKKPLLFLCFQGMSNGNIDQKWVKKINLKLWYYTMHRHRRIW